MANKPDWLNERSAAIPIIKDKSGFNVVLVTTKPKEKDNWIFPKGQVELGMTAYDSAAKEAFEEAGVIGRINSTLFDQYQHQKWGGKMLVKVYTLEVTEILDTWDEMRDRNRQIVPLDQAIEIVHSVQKETLIKLKQQLF
ncbi:NUDIX hydrolase [Thiomicrorhabdus sp. 6S2-11]|uniref:NUDIX hydrolase n=1 Tax=Thiomicrorhabdus marina TaxID=2818442 RepID=A0ABS3Q0X6_9GAMM|nr:NUDIX hydrolase [Thiomicrorhabdus marina]MBO1925967.1 NUDIX hydrolase [Thiomicrorhabdus marina]